MVGGPVGAQVGFLAGSLIGSLIDPPKQYGPRLTDLKLQVSSYGKMIPMFWGTGRIAGNMIDQTDLEEHEQKSGGKGGPEVISYTYSVSLMIGLGGARRFDEEVIQGCNRVWADGRLIWDVANGEECPFTIYKGGEDQIVDPTFEAIHGVGEVPAYRGQALAVTADMYVTDFNNRVPQFEFEVFTNAGEYPYYVATGVPWFLLNYNVPHFTMENGILTVSRTFGGTYAWMQFDVGNNLAQIGATQYSTPGPGVGLVGSINSHVVPNLDSPGTFYWASPNPSGIFTQGSDESPTGAAWQGNSAVTVDGFQYHLHGLGACTISRWVEGGGFVNSYSVGSSGSANYGIGYDQEESKVYVSYNGTGGGGVVEMWKFDTDLNLEHHWTNADFVGTLANLASAGLGNNFIVYQNQLCFQYHSGLIFYAALIDIGTAYALSDSTHGPMVLLAQGRFAYLGNGLVACQGNGVFSLVPPPETVLLSQIVSDLSDMTPLSGAYDVSELDIPVRWFVVGSQMQVKNAVQALRSCFFFDGVEEDDVVKFYLRDLTGSPHRTIYSIPESDLNARSYGNQSSELLHVVRKREQELPRTVFLNYIDVDHDYQVGTQSSPRQTTGSEQDTTIEVPIGLTADEALQKCWTLQTSEWVERESFEWSTTRKWAKLGPCSIVEVQGRVIRIQKKTEQPDGVIKWSGVLAAPSTYITQASSLFYQPAPGAPSDGFVPPTPPLTLVSTRLVMMDLPLVTDTDSPNGYYAAMGPNGVGAWSGAELFKSIDGGSSYSSIGSTATEDVIGDVALAIGDFGGGNTFDEANLITVVLTSGTLSSASELGVLNGANLCALGTPSGGWELIQFKNATLIADNTYLLDGLLRGCRGTDWMMGQHTTQEVFVLLPTTVNVAGPFVEIGVARQFKAVTYGKTLASATAVAFTNNAVALKPYSPVQVGGGWANGDVTISWTRRTRIAGAWLDNVEVPLSEATEQYALNFYTNGSYTTFVTTAFATSESITITNAELTSVYGSPPPNENTGIFGDVAQLGSYGYGYATRFAV